MAITKDEARLIISAIDGALGKVLERISGGNVAVPPVTGKADARLSAMTPPVTGPGADYSKATGGAVPVGDDFEKLYQQIKRRLIDECRVDPILLQLLTSSAPELRIDIEPRVLELAESSLRGRIALLVASGFFDGPRTQADTIRELQRARALNLTRAGARKRLRRWSTTAY
jgi:hypothetical protein